MILLFVPDTQSPSYLSILVITFSILFYEPESLPWYPAFYPRPARARFLFWLCPLLLFPCSSPFWIQDCSYIHAGSQFRLLSISLLDPFYLCSDGLLGVTIVLQQTTSCPSFSKFSVHRGYLWYLWELHILRFYGLIFCFILFGINHRVSCLTVNLI